MATGHRQQGTIDLAQSTRAIGGAVVLGGLLLLGTSWFLLQFVRLLRPAGLDGLSFRRFLVVNPDGTLAVELPLLDVVIAFVLVAAVHELVHGVAYWRLGGQRPRFGIKGLLPYAAAPPEVTFWRNEYLLIGIAPLVLLTVVGLLLMLLVPAGALSLLVMFIAFNVAGSAGDLVMVRRLLSYPPDTLMADRETGVAVYGPEGSQDAG